MWHRTAAVRTPIVIAAVAALLAGAAACGKRSEKQPAGTGSGSSAVPTAPTTPTTPAGPPDPRSQAIIARSGELRDRACACKDAACAQGVRQDHDTWLYEQVAEIQKSGPPPSSKAEEEQASEAQRALFECLRRYGADENTPDTQPPDVQLAPPIDAAAAAPTTP